MQCRPGELVFATAAGKPVDYKSIMERNFTPLLKAAGIVDRVESRNIRHTLSGISLLAGASTRRRAAVVNCRRSKSSIYWDTPP